MKKEDKIALLILLLPFLIIPFKIYDLWKKEFKTKNPSFEDKIKKIAEENGLTVEEAEELQQFIKERR